MFSAGGKLVFSGRQKHFELLCKKKLPLDGQNRRAKYLHSLSICMVPYLNEPDYSCTVLCQMLTNSQILMYEGV